MLFFDIKRGRGGTGDTAVYVHVLLQFLFFCYGVHLLVTTQILYIIPGEGLVPM